MRGNSPRDPNQLWRRQGLPPPTPIRREEILRNSPLRLPARGMTSTVKCGGRLYENAYYLNALGCSHWDNDIEGSWWSSFLLFCSHLPRRTIGWHLALKRSTSFLRCVNSSPASPGVGAVSVGCETSTSSIENISSIHRRWCLCSHAVQVVITLPPFLATVSFRHIVLCLLSHRLISVRHGNPRKQRAVFKLRQMGRGSHSPPVFAHS